MEVRKLIDALGVAERLKDVTRHCYTKNGRHESVAEHSWMMTLMAFFIKDEVLTCMKKLRASADKAETLTNEAYWPYPSYGKLLFSAK